MRQTPVSRRDLARHLALGTAALVAGDTVATADDDKLPDGADDGPTSLDIQMAWLFDRYPGEHLTDEQRAEIRRDVQRRRNQSSLLRQFPLDHDDAPALTFAAYRDDR